MMPKQPSSDPRPVPPKRPGNDDCCRSGCEPCVFELYEEALERYYHAMLAWEQRHPEKIADKRDQ